MAKDLSSKQVFGKAGLPSTASGNQKSSEGAVGATQVATPKQPSTKPGTVTQAGPQGSQSGQRQNLVSSHEWYKGPAGNQTKTLQHNKPAVSGGHAEKAVGPETLKAAQKPAFDFGNLAQTSTGDSQPGSQSKPMFGFKNSPPVVGFPTARSGTASGATQSLASNLNMTSFSFGSTLQPVGPNTTEQSSSMSSFFGTSANAPDNASFGARQHAQNTSSGPFAAGTAFSSHASPAGNQLGYQPSAAGAGPFQSNALARSGVKEAGPTTGGSSSSSFQLLNTGTPHNHQFPTRASLQGAGLRGSRPGQKRQRSAIKTEQGLGQSPNLRRLSKTTVRKHSKRRRESSQQLESQASANNLGNTALNMARCGACRSATHVLADCMTCSPTATGDLVGCPICNTIAHEFDDCRVLTSSNVKPYLEWDFLVLRRIRKIPIRSRTNWLELAPSMGEPPGGYPWSREFVRNALKGPLPLWGAKYKYAQDEPLLRLPDPNTMSLKAVSDTLARDELRSQSYQG